MSGKHIIAGFCLVVAFAAAVWWLAHEPFPKTSTPESLQLMRALYTACSSKNETRLTKVEQSLANAFQLRHVTAEERSAFEAIIATAKSGDWKHATTESYRFAKDQLR